MKKMPKVDVLNLEGEKTATRDLPETVFDVRARPVVFANAVSTDGCGSATSAVGPFYCPADGRLYIDPGFYDAEVSIFINMKKWQGLTAKQREFLQQQVINFEGRNDFWKAYGQEEIKRQAAAGIKTITFDAATRAAYLKQAYDAGWGGVIKLSPQHGPAMQKLFTKK